MVFVRWNCISFQDKIAPVSPRKGAGWVRGRRAADDEDRRKWRELGESLRIARERAGLSQLEVAARLGVHQPYVSLIERGGRNLTLTSIAAFARAVECDYTIVLTPLSAGDDAVRN